jgi:hypothetical protein
MKYFTDLFVTLNTKLSVARYADIVIEEAAQEMLNMISSTFLNDSKRILSVQYSPPGNNVLSTKIPLMSAEVGNRRGMLHAHFVLEVVSRKRFHLSNLNKTLQTYFDDFYPGCYVRATLASSSRAKNYAAKKHVTSRIQIPARRIIGRS